MPVASVLQNLILGGVVVPGGGWTRAGGWVPRLRRHVEIEDDDAAEPEKVAEGDPPARAKARYALADRLRPEDLQRLHELAAQKVALSLDDALWRHLRAEDLARLAWNEAEEEDLLLFLAAGLY